MYFIDHLDLHPHRNLLRILLPTTLRQLIPSHYVPCEILATLPLEIWVVNIQSILAMAHLFEVEIGNWLLNSRIDLCT